MKRNVSILCTILLISSLLFFVTSCSENFEKSYSRNSRNYEEELLGSWGCASGEKVIMYFFEKDDDGNYTAGCGIYNGGSQDIYTFDEFSASRTVITFKQDGKRSKHNYSFEGDYLYIDGLEFEKVE